MLKPAVAILALALPTAALCGENHVNLIAQEGQVSRMDDGIEVVQSEAALSGARVVELESPVKKRGTLSIEVYNAGGEPLNFGPENVRAELADGTVVPIITYDQLAREERSRQTWTAVLAGLAGAANSLAASNAGNSYGYIGRTPFSVHNNATSYLAQSLAYQQNRQLFSDVAVIGAQRMQALRQNIRTSTVDPQSSFGGAVVFELPRDRRRIRAPLPIRFAVTVGNETHYFLGCIQPEIRRGQTPPTGEQCTQGLTFLAPPPPPPPPAVSEQPAPAVDGEVKVETQSAPVTAGEAAKQGTPGEPNVPQAVPPAMSGST